MKAQERAFRLMRERLQHHPEGGGILQGQGPGGRAKMGGQEQPTWTRVRPSASFLQGLHLVNFPCSA